MSQPILLYHGSDHIVSEPKFGAGKLNNDFGQGFYCTREPDLAKEWAVSSLSDGYANCYEIDLEYMKVLNLNSEAYSILNWIAVLVEHRVFSLNYPIARRAKNYLIENFGINVNAYDVIIGYRADDSYFDFADAFLNNAITVEQLAEAMRLGKLGEQVVIKSQYAFSLLKYKGCEEALADEFYIRRKKRNDDAGASYRNIAAKIEDGIYMLDIIREEIKNGDARIPGALSE